jgi:hypothetical protein
VIISRLVQAGRRDPNSGCRIVDFRCGDSFIRKSLTPNHQYSAIHQEAIVPQLALSAGTMIACACKEIVMGHHSSLGPIDPQFRGIPAHGVIEEFKRAFTEIQAEPAKAMLWQPIIGKYNPTLIGECEKAIIWANEMATKWLISGMLEGVSDAATAAAAIVKELTDQTVTMSHARHLSADRCRELGLTVTELEKDTGLQDRVLSVHHAFVHTLSATAAYKIIENQNGVAFIQVAQQMVVKA